jgi:hypothetical protein
MRFQEEVNGNGEGINIITAFVRAGNAIGFPRNLSLI